MESAFLLAKENLLNFIHEQKLENNKLYSEEELFKILDSSRGAVREVLRSLEHEGVITKKYFVGTFMHPHRNNLKTRVEKIQDFIRHSEGSDFEAAINNKRELFFYSFPGKNSGGGLESFLEKDLPYFCTTTVYLVVCNSSLNLFFITFIYVLDTSKPYDIM